MKKLTSLLVISTFTCLSLSAQKSTNSTNSTPLKTVEDSVSYGIGLDIANNLIQNKLDTLINSKAIAQGIIDGLNQNNYKIHPDKAKEITKNYFTKLQQNQKADENKKYQKNIQAGKNFLETNKSQPGVIVNPSGLQYKIITQGNGPKPTMNDQVTLHYKGTLIDGTIFDSSIDRGEPATFGVTQVIPGFSEAIQLMNVGSKYIVYIPQELAYGDRQQGAIEPFSTLIFEIELLAIPTQVTTPPPAAVEEPAPAPAPVTKDKKKGKKE